MIRGIIHGTALASMAVLLSATVVLAGNPAGTGQPGASCGADGATVMPHGFTTAGFANAELHYAGNGPSAQHANSPHAVSQYDVACYQLTLHAH